MNARHFVWALALPSLLVPQYGYSFVKQQRPGIRILDQSLSIAHKVVRALSSKDVLRSSSLPAGLEYLSDAKSGAIRVIWGDFGIAPVSQRRLAAKYLEVIEGYVNANNSIFGLSFAEMEELIDSRYVGPDEQFFKFAALRDGSIIKDSSIDFRFKYGRLVQVINQSYAEVASPQGEELENLKEIVSQTLVVHEITATQRYFRLRQEEGNYSLIEVQVFETRGNSDEIYTVEIDVHTGEIYELRSNFYFNTGHAHAAAYPRWYNESIESHPLAFLDLASAAGTIRTDITGTFDAANTARPRIADGLGGRHVILHDMGNNPIRADGFLVDDKWVVDVKANDNSQASMDERVAQNMIYTKSDAMFRHALKYVDTPWLHTRLRANANLRNHCNAHWDGRTINLYTGNSSCANTGLIADVIYHEWGHGYDANTGGIQDGAFSEGLGDIMSLLMTRSHLLGIGFRLPDHSPVRDLEPDRIYPQDAGGDVHAEGLIIGSTFWDLYKALRDKHGEEKAVDILSNYVFKMTFTARTYLDVYQALLVIDDDDAELSNGTPNLCLINATFAAHGLAAELEACQLATLAELAVDDLDGDGIMEPGESIEVRVAARNPASATLKKLVGEIKIFEPGIKINRAKLFWDDIPPAGVAFARESVSLEIDASVPCGKVFSGEITLSASGRTVSWPQVFQIGKNIGQLRDYHASGLPLPIRDFQKTEAVWQISDAEWDQELKLAKGVLSFAIDHSYVGDLKVALIPPGSEAISVYTGKGGGNDVRFTQDITELLKDKKIGGQWSLSVTDNALRDQGSLKSVALKLQPEKFLCQ